MRYTVILFICLLLAGFANAQDSLKNISSTGHADSSEMYGLIPQLPVMVGGLYTVGAVNQRKYLESLRDAQGNRITYERKGACCPYPSENGMGGYALVDKYEVKYRDAENKKQKLYIYISFYDYEEPKAVKGFTLVE